MRRNLFFDVDGTLLPFGQSLPEDTRQALEEASSRGHRIFLSTGRSPAELDGRLSAVHFDGGVYSGGARAFAGGGSVFSSSFSKEEIAHYLNVCRAHGWMALLQTDSRSFCTEAFARAMLSLFERFAGGDIHIANVELVDSLPAMEGVTKMLLLAPEGDMEEAHRLLDPGFDIIANTVGVPASLLSEVCQKGVDKAVAMRAILASIGEDVESAIAFGDGSNDIGILMAAGTGVAMGNADECVKSVADYVTLECGKGGIAHALRHFGVI